MKKHWLLPFLIIFLLVTNWILGNTENFEWIDEVLFPRYHNAMSGFEKLAQRTVPGKILLASDRGFREILHLSMQKIHVLYIERSYDAEKIEAVAMSATDPITFINVIIRFKDGGFERSYIDRDELKKNLKTPSFQKYTLSLLGITILLEIFSIIYSRKKTHRS